MAYRDMKVAVFSSQYLGGEVELWYCPHSSSYELRYDMEFCSPDGLCSAVAVVSYGAGDNAQVAALVLDAVDIARTPLLDRD